MVRILGYGEKSVLIEQIDPASWLKPLSAVLPQAKLRAGLNSLLVTFTESGQHVSQVEKILETIEPETNLLSGNLFTISVNYNGADLESAAELAALKVNQLIEAHTSITWQVKLIGFAPGFPYLVPTEESKYTKLLSKIGRLAIPRRQVPAGSVGLAAGMSCIYPSAMPGGWQLIGVTEVELFDALNKEKPNLLSIGDQLRFEVSN